MKIFNPSQSNNTAWFRSWARWKSAYWWYGHPELPWTTSKISSWARRRFKLNIKKIHKNHIFLVTVDDTPARAGTIALIVLMTRDQWYPDIVLIKFWPEILANFQINLINLTDNIWSLVDINFGWILSRQKMLGTLWTKRWENLGRENQAVDLWERFEK